MTALTAPSVRGHAATVAALDPDSPVASLLALAGLTQAALGQRMGIPQSSVAAAVARGQGVSVDWLLRAAEAAGLRLEIAAKKKR